MHMVFGEKEIRDLLFRTVNIGTTLLTILKALLNFCHCVLHNMALFHISILYAMGAHCCSLYFLMLVVSMEHGEARQVVKML